MPAAFFLTAEALLDQEPRQRSGMSHTPMRGGTRGSQLRHGDVAVLFHPANQDRGVRCPFPPAWRLPLPRGSHGTCRGHPLCTPDTCAGADPEATCRRSTRRPFLNRDVNPNPKVRRGALAHDLPPRMVNHKSALRGITFDSDCRLDALNLACRQPVQGHGDRRTGVGRPVHWRTGTPSRVSSMRLS